MGTEFEDKYLDVLQNIESGIVSVFRKHPEMTDWDAQNAVEGLVRTYQAEGRQRRAPVLRLAPLAQETFDAVRVMCEWRLGRREAVHTDDEGKSDDIPMRTVTLDEMIACLKRIRSSIELWNKEGGRRGYLNFVSQFV